jgi:hypothetical protein
MSAPTL